MSAQMTSVRLSAETRNKLESLARVKHVTKSDVIKESIDRYYEAEESDWDSLFLGEGFFGNYGSGESDRATTYKRRIKEKLSGRLNPH
jgi:predicted DNA-binding protein